MCLGIFYVLLLSFTNSYFELNSFNIFSVCLYKEETESPKLLFNFISTTLPIFTLLTVTIALDISCFFFVLNRRNTVQDIQTQFQINQNHSNILDDIPFRASLISTFVYLILITGYFIISIENIHPLEKYVSVIIICRVNDICKSPLIATCAFKVNDENRQRNSAEERERKRQLEIQDALRRRAERLAKKSHTNEVHP